MRQRSERTYALDSQLEEEAAAEALKVATVFGACHSDACAQGRKPCPTAEACQLAEFSEPSRLDTEGRVLMAWLIAVPTLVLIVGLVAAFWPAGWSVL